MENKGRTLQMILVIMQVILLGIIIKDIYNNLNIIIYIFEGLVLGYLSCFNQHELWRRLDGE